SARIEMLQRGIQVAKSPLHTYFIIAEIIKIVCLLFSGLKCIRRSISETNQQKHFGYDCL
ncbi:MAG TPA: hypothetical protein VK369_01530, partial [Segetibacter sp.]|nr:hypothetical protein [Segetibacter sp.]